MLPGV